LPPTVTPIISTAVPSTITPALAPNIPLAIAQIVTTPTCISEAAADSTKQTEDLIKSMEETKSKQVK